MNSPSVFQSQYPLSPAKFWKKMIGKLFSALFLSVFFGVMLTTMIGALLTIMNKTTGFGLFVTLALLAFATVFILTLTIYGAYIHEYIRRYYYDANDQFLSIQKGVFAPTEIHVPYVKIQDVYVDQDVLDRMMGLYDVHIASATATSGIEAHIDGVNAEVAERLKNFLLQKIQYGGQMMAMQGNAAPVQNVAPAPAMNAAQGPQAGVFSSKNYPIADSWLLATFIGNLWVAAWYAVFFWFFFVGRLQTPFGWSLAIVLYVLIYALISIWVVLWKNAFYFELMPQFIMMKDGVIKREEKHVPYRALQNVLLKRNLVDRMFGLSTVIIENAAMGYSKTGRASRITLPGQPLEKGTALVDELNRILSQSLPGQNMMGL